MPGTNGFEFVRKIREINPAIKVLLMSAFEVNSAELSAGLGSTIIDEFIQKPVALHELKTIVQKQLECSSSCNYYYDMLSKLCRNQILI